MGVVGNGVCVCVCVHVQWVVSRLTLSMHMGIRKAGMKKEGKTDGPGGSKATGSEKKLT